MYIHIHDTHMYIHVYTFARIQTPNTHIYTSYIVRRPVYTEYIVKCTLCTIYCTLG